MRALVFVSREVPAEVERAMQLELSVEAQRLGFELCRSADGPPAVTAQVDWTAVSAQLEVTVGQRVIVREVPFEGDSNGKVLELALILGDLVREALAPLVLPTPEPARLNFRVGLRGGVDVFPVTLGVLYTGALVLRLQGPRFGFATALGANTSRVVETAAGSISLAGILAEFTGLLRILHKGPLRLYGTGGVQLSAVLISAAAVETAQARPAWAATGDVRLGGALEVSVGRFNLELRLGAALPARGLTALSDRQPVIGIGGPGFYTSLGISLGRLEHP